MMSVFCTGWLDIPQIVSQVMGNALLHVLLFLHVITQRSKVIRLERY